MATLPAFFRRSEAQAYMEATRRTAPARAERDPFQLRALPQEDVFLYAKKIDNSRLVREHDAKAHGACWSAIGSAAVILVLLTGILAPSVATTLAGYKLEALRAEERRLTDESRMLDLQEAQLLRPDRLEQLAQKQNLVTPSNGQVFHLETQADGTVALVK
jgi:cell division protein FtsL